MDGMPPTEPAPSFIAILDLTTAAENRPSALSQLQAEQPVVRALPGSIAFRVYAAPDNDTDLAVVHEWADEAAFDGYLASESFDRFGTGLRPLLTAAPRSRRFRAELAETAD